MDSEEVRRLKEQVYSLAANHEGIMDTHELIFAEKDRRIQELEIERDTAHRERDEMRAALLPFIKAWERVAPLGVSLNPHSNGIVETLKVQRGDCLAAAALSPPTATEGGG